MAFNDYKLKFQIDADTHGVDRAFDGLHGRIGGLGRVASTAFNSFIPVAGAAAYAIAGVGVALFSVTKKAADFGSEIYDASQKTGLGATALSSLKAAAETSGASLESVTKGIAKFAKSYEGTGKDLQEELGKVMKQVAAAKPGFEQLTLAQKHFGKAGADLIPVIRSFDGDLPGLIKHMSELGVTIDDEAAAAADAFGDQMDLLSMQLAGVGRTIGTALMPAFTDMASDMSDWLSENKDEIRQWGVTTSDILSGIAMYWKDATAAVSEYMAESRAFGKSPFGDPSSMWMPMLLGAGGMAALTRGATARITKQQQWDNVVQVTGDPSTYVRTNTAGVALSPSTTGGGAGAAKKNPLPAFGSMKALVITSGNAQWDSWFTQMGTKFGVDPNVLLLQALGESSFNKNAVSPKGARGFSQFMPGTAARFGVDTSSIKDSIRGQAQYMSVLLSMFGGNYEKALAGYNAGEGAVQKYGGIPPFKETRNYVSKIKGAYGSRVRSKDGSYGSYDYDAEAEARRRADEQETADMQKALDEYLRDSQHASDVRLDIRQTESNLALEILNSQLQAGYIDELEYADRVGQMRIDMLNDERDEVADLFSTAENIHRLKKLDLEIDAARLKKAHDIAAAVEKQNDAYWEQVRARDAADKKVNQRPGTLQKRKMYGESGGMEGLHEYFSDQGNAVAAAGVDVLTQAFNGLGDALGAAASAWVLYGSAGQSARQVTAQILASIAQQATVKAVWELAEGFAMLALSWFTGNPKYAASAAGHFTAAAIYGTVAAVSAGVGRGVAGNSFKNQSGSGGSGSGSGGSGSGRSSDNPTPISRQNENTFLSGRSKSDRLVAEAIGRLTDKLEAMRPGDVLRKGMEQSRGAVARQVLSDIKSNSSLGTEMQKLSRGGRR